MAERKPAVHRKSSSKAVKARHRSSLKTSPGVSLRTFAKGPTLGDADFAAKVGDWFFNKKANFAKPPQGIGATRKKKTTQGKKAA